MNERSGSAGSVRIGLDHAPVVSPNWQTVRHTRLPLEDAIRNGGVLARGIFANVNVDRVLGRVVDNQHANLRDFTEADLAARKMLIGYLSEQGHSLVSVALSLRLNPVQLRALGWQNSDWLTNAQDEARVYANSERSLRELAKRQSIERKAVIADHVLDVVSDEFEVSIAEITGPKRFRKLTLPRFAGSSLFVVDGGKTLEATGQIMGGRDHSTITHHIERSDVLRREDELFAASYDRSSFRLQEIAFAAVPLNTSVTVFPSA